MPYYETVSPRTSIGLLLLRIIIGLAFVVHGWPKIQHPASWMTMMMGPRAFAPPWLQAIAAVVEFFGGIALILGFLTPLVALGILVDMTVAILTVHVPMGGHWIGGRGSFETPLFYLVAMLAFLLIGPGRLSIDATLARSAMRRAPT
jgi:putative oxidoreductase